MSPYPYGDYRKIYDFLQKYSILKIDNQKYFKPPDSHFDFKTFKDIFGTIAMNYQKLQEYYDYSHKNDKESGGEE